MTVGSTSQFTAVNNLGRPQTNVTWTLSNQSLATISAASSTILTATAAGQLTLTASVDGVSGQAQITILPTGSVPMSGSALWSVPAVSGFSPLQLAQAMPSGTGPDLYSAQLSTDGTQSILQALTADGQELWQSQLPALNSHGIPDAFGGIILTESQTCLPGQTNPMNIVNIDGASGHPLWQITAQSTNGLYCYPDAPMIAVRAATDGAVVISASGNTSGLPELLLVNGRTGQTIVAPNIPPSFYTNQSGTTLGGYSPIGPPMVNSDGSIYVEYEVRQIAYPLIVTSAQLYMLQIATDNSTTTTLLSSTTADENLFPGRIIPNGLGGILATWTISRSNPPIPTNPYQAAYVVSGGIVAAYSLPFTPQNFVLGQDGLPLSPSLVLGENGVAFATDGSSTGDSTNPSLGPKISSIMLTSGAVNWSYQVGTQSKVSIMASEKGNGIEIDDTQAGVTHLDSNGNPSQVAAPPGGIAQNSWYGHWYVQNPEGTDLVKLPTVDLPASFWAVPGGNQSSNGAAIQQVQTNQQQGTSHQIPAQGASLNSNYNSIELLTTATPDFIFNQYIQTFAGVQIGNGNDIATVPVGTNITDINQTVAITLTGDLVLLQPPFKIASERFAPEADTLSVVTLTGHPLAGWRYWRAYSVGTNDVVIETGAVDTNGPGLLNWTGYWIFRYRQMKMWQEYLEYIESDIHNHWDHNSVQGSQLKFNIVDGAWNPSEPSQGDILFNICQSTTFCF